MNLGIDDTVTFKPDTHQYFDKIGNEYRSVTRILNKIREPFDRAKISSIMANKIAREEGISHKQAQSQLLSEWDRIRDSSIDHGNSIHDGIDYYLRTGNSIYELSGVFNFIHELISPFYRYYHEVILHDAITRIAGTADLVVQRQKTSNSLYDFYDYKTNESKGIQFDSISRKEDLWKHYNRMLLPPFDYLEDCNYTIYSFQLSIYAYIASITYGINIGRLGIIFVDNNLKSFIIPVFYMKEEVITLVNHILKLNPVRDPKGMIAQKIESIKNEEEDW